MTREISNSFYSLKADLSAGKSGEDGADEVLSDLMTEIAGIGIEIDVVRFVREFPDTGPAGLVAFVRARWTNVLVDLEMALMTGAGRSGA